MFISKFKKKKLWQDLCQHKTNERLSKDLHANRKKKLLQ